jgi:hypothetical protein
VRRPNVSRDHDAFIFRVKKKKLLALPEPEEEGAMILATSGITCLMTHHHIPDDFKHAVII